MKDFDILCRRVELLEKKVDALEMEVIVPKMEEKDCSPGETCNPSDTCPEDDCCSSLSGIILCNDLDSPCTGEPFCGCDEPHPTFAGNPDDQPDG